MPADDGAAGILQFGRYALEKLTGLRSSQRFLFRKFQCHAPKCVDYQEYAVCTTLRPTDWPTSAAHQQDTRSIIERNETSISLA
jgi:hypothetical protein